VRAPGSVDRCWATFVHSGFLGLGDALELALFTQVGLELGEHPQHVQEAFSGRGTGVDWLLRGLEGGALRLQGAHDVLKVPDAARPGDRCG
jgi:hypothetical protein